MRRRRGEELGVNGHERQKRGNGASRAAQGREPGHPPHGASRRRTSAQRRVLLARASSLLVTILVTWLLVRCAVRAADGYGAWEPAGIGRIARDVLEWSSHWPAGIKLNAPLSSLFGSSTSTALWATIPECFSCAAFIAVMLGVETVAATEWAVAFLRAAAPSWLGSGAGALLCADCRPYHRPPCTPGLIPLPLLLDLGADLAHLISLPLLLYHAALRRALVGQVQLLPRNRSGRLLTSLPLPRPAPLPLCGASSTAASTTRSVEESTRWPSIHPWCDLS